MSSTGLVVNSVPSKQLGLPQFYYRRTTCNPANGASPATQYETLKRIQRTVRVDASLYTANVAPLTAYRRPTAATHGVCWNQMSDRPFPSRQRVTVPTAANTTLNRRHTSVTSSRPGCQTPGGIGCDIKHNSYDRYLNRLKGRGPLRRGPVPPRFGDPIPFNCAFPVYGGKTMKTNIVNGCDCPDTSTPAERQAANERIYGNPNQQPWPLPSDQFQVGDYVYARESLYPNLLLRAIVLSIDADTGAYTIRFDDGVEETVPSAADLLLYYPCNCAGTVDGITFRSGFIVNYQNAANINCVLPTANFLNGGFTGINDPVPSDESA